MKFKTDKTSSLLDVIKEKMGYASNSKARNLIKSGAVKLDDKVVKIRSGCSLFRCPERIFYYHFIRS